jgi:acyl-CoA reductase-like NAD-dependent aldehyde dehydrogenase
MSMRHDRPLALYWFGNDAAERERVLRQTLAGGVTVNDTLMAHQPGGTALRRCGRQRHGCVPR